MKFGCLGIEARMKAHYTEIYHDHINSIFVIKDAGMTSLFESKYQTLLDYAGQYGCKNFVETGTGGGDTLDAVYPYFEHCYSIELSDELYRDVKVRFANTPTVELYHGDSSDILPMLSILKGTTLFFLDAHYSGPGTTHGPKETPILAELQSILSAKFNHVILIDDYKDFVTNPEYPTPDELKKFINNLRPGLSFEIVNKGGGMMLIAPANKKRNPEHKLTPITPRAVSVIFQAEFTQPREAQTFDRSPILYGPNR
jgi:hypothetical protein